MEGHVHLAQNTSDLAGMAKRMRGELIEIFFFFIDFVESTWLRVLGGGAQGSSWCLRGEIQRARRRAASWSIWAVLYAHRKMTHA